MSAASSTPVHRQRALLGPSVTGFTPDVAASIEAVADHLNAYHDDTIRLLAIAAGAAPTTLGAEIGGVTPHGIQLAVQKPRRVVDVLHLDFAHTRHTTDAVRGEVLDLVVWARERVGRTMATTTLETELATSGALPTHVTTVVAVRRVMPGMVQLTVRGGLDGFRPVAPDQFLYLITAMPGGRPVERGFTMAQYQQADGADRPPAAYYTVRRWRPERGEMDLWVVLHPHDGTVARWASRVTPGTPVALWGPRSSWDPPGDTTRLLLVGDETALPAISAVLEQRPAGQQAMVVLETDATIDALDLPHSPGVDLTWVPRDGRPRGTGSQLRDAVARLDPDPRGLYAFGAGERRQIGAVRRHLRHGCHIPGTQVRMMGYWQRTGPATP